MKYTLMYLKYLAVITLIFIIGFCFISAAAMVFVSILAVCLTGNLSHLCLAALGVFIAPIGFVAVDIIIYVKNKWRWRP